MHLHDNIGIIEERDQDNKFDKFIKPWQLLEDNVKQGIGNRAILASLSN